MSGLSWSSVVRGLAWALAVAFFLSAVLIALLSFEVLGPPPQRGDDFIQFTLDSFRWEQDRWPIEFAASALSAIAFLALAGLGPALRLLTPPQDGRRGIVGTAFLTAGLLGAASQLVWIGAKPIATSTQYCDCGFLQEEIMSRLMILNVVGGIEGWLINGALIVLSVGLVAVAKLGQEAGMPVGWRRLSLAIAALSLVGVAMTFFDVYPLDALLVLLIAGVLAPVWALWLSRRATVLWPMGTGVVASMPPD